MSGHVSRFIGTANHGFFRYAQDELRSLIPGSKFAELVADEVYVMDFPLSREAVIATMREREPVFLRHMHPVELEIRADGTTRDLEQVRQFAESHPAIAAEQPVAVQARKAAGVKADYTPYAIKETVDAALAEKQAIAVISGAQWVVSVFVASESIYMGVSRPESNLSDWSGGAVRFRKEEEQISRAKFKLLEAELKFGLDFAAYSSALDIGAAPGGWTSLLLERGLAVTAVDPGAMHPSLLHHPKLTYLRANASELDIRRDRFDLLTCDMSWSPRQMSRLVKPLLPALTAGGTAVITLKLMHGKPFQTIKETVRFLGPELVLLKAKQLFHNRDELTMLFAKAAQP